MIRFLFTLWGGIGLFLLGMTLLTDGLKSFAADGLRRFLIRSTERPVRAFASGALVTALVQSSSATTVTMIGFVSAGLLTFPQALGVLLGASLGTTSTGWIVSVVGLKVNLGYYALPMVGAGAFVRLLGRERWKSLGMAVAGFGLIFIAIGTLQEAMQLFPGGGVNPSGLPSGGFLNRALAVAAGAGMTVVLQSSSAAVAMTLTALHTQSVTFEQAALLVIGASIGTTATGALAAIGASAPARRTALALILLNGGTGVMALALLPLLLRAIVWAQQTLGLEAGAASLAAFHSLFTAVGVAVFLPSLEPFARWMERTVPDEASSLTGNLDKSLLNVPTVALEAVRRSLIETAATLTADLRAGLGSGPVGKGARLEGAVQECREFFEKIPPVAEDRGVSGLRVALVHAFDHLLRLEGYRLPPANIRRVLGHPRLQDGLAECRDLLAAAEAGLRGNTPEGWLARVEGMAKGLEQASAAQRREMLGQTAEGRWQPQEALDLLDGMRWFSRIGHHCWRAAHYLRGMDRPGDAEAPGDTWEPGGDEPGD